MRITLRSRTQSITMVKTIYWIQHKQKNRSRKNGEKDGKVLHKLINNAVYGRKKKKKKKKNLRNRIDVKLVNNENNYLKCTLKPSYMLHKIFDNNSGVIWKSKVSLKLNKPASIGMRILELGKVLMYEFHYDYIKYKYDEKSKLLLTETDSLMHGIKTEDFMKILAAIKKCLILVIIHLIQNTMMIQIN